MQWFEYLIIVAAVALVVLPILLKIRAFKKNKGVCSCGKSCSSCGLCKLKQEKIIDEIHNAI